MASVTFTGAGPLVANVHFGCTTVRDVLVRDLGDGLVQIELADAEIGVSLIGPRDLIHALIIDADTILTRLRNRRA